MGFPDKNTGVGCHFLLQGIFPTQGSTAPPALAGGCFTTSATWEASSSSRGKQSSIPGDTLWDYNLMWCQTQESIIEGRARIPGNSLGNPGKCKWASLPPQDKWPEYPIKACVEIKENVEEALACTWERNQWAAFMQWMHLYFRLLRKITL